MKRVYPALAISIFLFSCRPSVIAPYDLNLLLKPGIADSAGISGSWILIATRHYSVPNNTDTNWKQIDTTQAKAVIGFSLDSIFTYNNHYTYQAQDYDRYNYLDTGIYASDPAFRIFATRPPTGAVPHLPSFARLLNADALVITYMGVDTGVEELYVHTSG